MTNQSKGPCDVKQVNEMILCWSNPFTVDKDDSNTNHCSHPVKTGIRLQGSTPAYMGQTHVIQNLIWVWFMVPTAHANTIQIWWWVWIPRLCSVAWWVLKFQCSQPEEILLFIDVCYESLSLKTVKRFTRMSSPSSVAEPIALSLSSVQ